MPNPTTTTPAPPTPAEILSVTLRPELVEAAQHYIRMNEPMTNYVGPNHLPVQVRWKRDERTYETIAATCAVTVPDLRLAVRVLRHLEQQKMKKANG